MPRPGGALLNLDPRSMFLGWTELLHIVSESPRGWLLVYLARQSRDPSNQGWLLRKNLAGVSNTSINRLLRTPYTATATASLRPSDQKPRHPVTCSTCAGGKMQGLRLLTPQGPACQPKTWSAGMLTCSRRSALRYPKAYGFVFWGRRAVSAFLGSLRRQPGVYSSTSLSTPARVMHHRRRKKWASRGITVWRD
jgi:hypothetical protein